MEPLPSFYNQTRKIYLPLLIYQNPSAYWTIPLNTHIPSSRKISSPYSLHQASISSANIVPLDAHIHKKMQTRKKHICTVLPQMMSLRWHYPNQVLRVKASHAYSQPILISSPYISIITSLKKHNPLFPTKSFNPSQHHTSFELLSFTEIGPTKSNQIQHRTSFEPLSFTLSAG